VHGGRIWRKEVNTFFAFSFGEKVAESRMRGYFKLLIFLVFPFRSIPHPPLTWSPLSQNGRGFLDCVELKAVCHWAMVLSALISFENLIFWVRSNQFVFCLLPQGIRWLKAG